MMPTAKILVVSHKPYIFPKVDYYLPIYVGNNPLLSKENGLFDCNGENIADKNHCFCELTALYWAWKNHFLDDIDILGMVHYRRYFKGKEIEFNGFQLLSEKEIAKWLTQYDCIVPKKRKYYIETVYQHYKNAHFSADLDEVRKIILEKYRGYLPAFDQVMNQRELYLFNMFIMGKENALCHFEWLFPILFELEKRIEIKDYSVYQQRVFGFIAERLFNVWLKHNQLTIKEIEIVNIEKEPIIKKAVLFLIRKIFKVKK